MKKLPLLVLFFVFHSLLSAQTESHDLDTMYWSNPSFESFDSLDIMHMSLHDWVDCGETSASPPTIHHESSSLFEVSASPTDGNYYISMVTRADETTESISQSFKDEFSPSRTYNFSLDLKKSEDLKSLEKGSKGEFRNFNTAIILRVWGATEECANTQLLFKSPPINHLEWENYTIEFTPEAPFRYMKLEVFYNIPVVFPQRGNILLDNLSPISQTLVE